AGAVAVGEDDAVAAEEFGAVGDEDAGVGDEAEVVVALAEFVAAAPVPGEEGGVPVALVGDVGRGGEEAFGGAGLVGAGAVLAALPVHGGADHDAGVGAAEAGEGVVAAPVGLPEAEF